MDQHEKEAWKLGLYWTKLDEKPEKGAELTHAVLSEALAGGKTVFERSEVDGFGVAGLAWDSFIEAGGHVLQPSYFQPSGRSLVETALFKHALGSLDVIYAHKMLASLLSTRLPNGVVLDRG